MIFFAVLVNFCSSFACLVCVSSSFHLSLARERVVFVPFMALSTVLFEIKHQQLKFPDGFSGAATGALGA